MNRSNLLLLPLLVLMLGAGASQGAFVPAGGKTKDLFDRVLYDPASHRFDSRLNVDRLRVRYLLSSRGLTAIASEMEKTPDCSPGLARLGAGAGIDLLMEFDGIGRMRTSDTRLIDGSGAVICAIPLDDDSWGSIQDGSTEYDIFYRIVLLPERGPEAGLTGGTP